MVKDVKYIYWVKKDLFGCFRIEEIREKDNETGLKEGGGIEMSIYSAPFAMLALFALNYLPIYHINIAPALVKTSLRWSSA